MKFSKTLFLFALVYLPFFLMAQATIERIEPPNWWAGMKHPKLQLLIYGEQVGSLEPSITYLGLRIEQVVKVENPNYLFLNLSFDVAVKAGTFNIIFSKDGKEVARREYELQERAGNGEHIEGFKNSEVVYLITPDRFVNGDASNDDITTMRERPNREFKGGRHGGDIEGLRKSLDYIVDLGFKAIWLNPLLENDMEQYSYHGYSTTDFYKVDPRFGTNEDYRQLAIEAKSKGVKLIMDMIVNHCGLFHWWMEDLPTSDWINQWENYTQTNHKKTLLQDPHAAESDVKVFTDGWFVPTMPDLNQRNPLMAEYLTQNAIWWVEYLGLAGIRMDTYPYPDMDYMTEWTRRVMLEYPDFNIVGEEWFEWPTIVSYWQEGKENANGYVSYLPTVMDFPLQASMSRSLNMPEEYGNSWNELYEMLTQDFLYPDPANLVVFPDNHDMSRIFTQVNEDFDLYKLALTYVLTTRGTPQLYYGTEILMKNPGTTDHGIIRTDFPGGWKGDKVNAFTEQGLTAQQKEAKAFVKKMIHWRNDNLAMHNGKMTHYIPEEGVYVYFRYNDDRTVMVVLNKNKKAASLKLDRFEHFLAGTAEGKEIISGKTVALKGNLELTPMSPMVIEVR